MLQHSWESMHPKPSGVHMPKPQVFPLGLQKPVQQSPFIMQGRPSGLQAFLPQVPWALHTAVQHWAEAVQKVPSWRQVTHRPWLGSQAFEQQSASLVQAVPFCEHLPTQIPLAQLPLQQGGMFPPQKSPLPRQAPFPHMLLVQAWLQHWDGALQGLPSGWQPGARQRPDEQMPEQHWLEAAHWLPSASHCWALQVPFGHRLEQHWPGWEQEAPRPRHEPLPHAPWVQVPEQHCAAVLQTKPSGWQELPQKPPVQGRPQQSLELTHAAPCGLHVVPPQ
jgi:hypothetical protein